MEAAAALLAIGLVGNKIIEFLKYLRNKDFNAAITMIILFVSGIVTITLAAQAAVTETLALPGTSIPLGSLDISSLILLGSALTATGSTIYDYKKAIDGGDSAKQPPLTGLPSGPPTG